MCKLWSIRNGCLELCIWAQWVCHYLRVMFTCIQAWEGNASKSAMGCLLWSCLILHFKEKGPEIQPGEETCSRSCLRSCILQAGNLKSINGMGLSAHDSISRWDIFEFLCRYHLQLDIIKLKDKKSSYWVFFICPFIYWMSGYLFVSPFIL